MEIFEIAALLGKTLKENEKLVRLENAKKAYKETPELNKMMIEYEVQQKALENEIVKPVKVSSSSRDTRIASSKNIS